MRVHEIRPGSARPVLAERPRRPLGLTEVRVRVRAASLNFRDLKIAEGSASRSGPLVPLSDGAGEVLEVGPAVRRWAVGDRVVGNFFPTWVNGLLSDAHHSQALGGGQDGMLAEEVVLPEHSWVRIPDHLDFEQAALRPGDVVLVQGTGGVSIFALQLAKATGAQVVLTSSSEDKRRRARALGADHVLDYRADPAWGVAAHAWTGGRGVDLVVDVGGPGTFDQSVAALRYGGQMSILGVLTGRRGEVNTHAVFHKMLKVAGIYVGSVEMFERFARALSATRLVPVVDRVFPFEQAAAAFDHLASGAHLGKVVVRI